MSLDLVRSRSSLATVRALPVIAEDDVDPPPIPSKSAARRSFLPSTLRTYRHHHIYSPFSPRPVITATSSLSDDGSLPDRKPEPGAREGFRDQEWVARRGGWCRLLLFALLVIVAVVGLSVGLALGLRKKNTSASSTDPPSTDPTSTLFPAGNYTFTLALANTTTTCTTNPATFRCYPYAVYSPSAPSSSAATFFWTIVRLPGTSPSYAISSTPNPFAPTFSSLALALLDPDQPTERLTFAFALSKPSIASGPLFADSGDDDTATCWANRTAMSVTLWTRLRADFPAGIAAAQVPANGTGADGAFAAWPFRSDVSQVQPGGAEVPDCRVGGRRVAGNEQLGTGEGECGCFYRNFGLDGGNATGVGSATAVATATATDTAAATGLVSASSKARRGW